MSELQTSHDEIISKIDASDKVSKEEQKKEFQKAFSTLRNMEVMHGKDSQEYAGALTEYTNLKNTIIAEYNIILTQSKREMLAMKDPSSFENKPYAEMSIDEAKQALKRLNEKYASLDEAGYTEKLLNKLRSGFPNTEGEVTSKRLANIAQESLVKKIVGENGFNDEFIAGFDTTQNGHYILSITEVESILKDSSRTISSGSDGQKINSYIVANYLKYLNNKAGGDSKIFKSLFTSSFGGKSSELVDLWKNRETSIAKKELESSGFGSVVEDVLNPEKFLGYRDTNELWSNMVFYGNSGVTAIKETLKGMSIEQRAKHFEDMNEVSLNPLHRETNPAACEGSKLFSMEEGVSILEFFTDDTDKRIKEFFMSALEKTNLNDEEKAALYEKHKLEIIKLKDSLKGDPNKIYNLAKDFVESINNILPEGSKVEFSGEEIKNFSLVITKIRRLEIGREASEKTIKAQQTKFLQYTTEKDETLDPSIKARARLMVKEHDDQAGSVLQEYETAKTQGKIVQIVAPETHKELSTASEEGKNKIIAEIQSNPEIQKIYREYGENMESLRRQGYNVTVAPETQKILDTIKAQDIAKNTPPIIETAQNLSSGNTLTSHGDFYTLTTPTGTSIELTEKEKTEIAASPEAEDNLVNFYETLSALGMQKIWDKREIILGAIEKSDRLFDRGDGDYIDAREIKTFLSYIVKSISDMPGFEWAQKDFSSHTTDSLLNIIRTNAYKNNPVKIETNGHSVITDAFFRKFFTKDEKNPQITDTFNIGKFQKSIG